MSPDRTSVTPNHTFDQTAGSRSLPAAGDRGRSAHSRGAALLKALAPVVALTGALFLAEAPQAWESAPGRPGFQHGARSSAGGPCTPRSGAACVRSAARRTRVGGRYNHCVGLALRGGTG